MHCLTTPERGQLYGWNQVKISVSSLINPAEGEVITSGTLQWNSINHKLPVKEMHTVNLAYSACLTLRKETQTTFQTRVWPVFVPVSFPLPRADCLHVRSIMMKLKNGSGRVAGVAVVAPNTNPLQGFSPHTTCPNENTGGWGFACSDLSPQYYTSYGSTWNYTL